MKRKVLFRVYLAIRRRVINYVRFIKRWLKWKFLSGYPHPKRLINESELQPQFHQALRCLKEKVGADAIGDYLEFGVFRGASLMLMHQELLRENLSKVRLFGFDSFEGLPYDEEEIWRTGAFCSNYDDTVKSLNKQNVNWDRTTLVKGFYSDTLTDTLVSKHNLKKASLIMIDCDMYLSAKQALSFCAPLILDRAVIFFDEWGWRTRTEENVCEKRAFREFLQENPEFRASEIGNYSYLPGDLLGKVFLVTRV